ncbi:formate dehydrogenase accessory sulfurtransferase FdhD [Vibrio profundum]|uniref:formate dehydrogenase accessory sulfurtransferase FdhD n=1 Tax=Vibrio profundum TaxID=2910247 RepID=UPI003D0D8F21
MKKALNKDVVTQLDDYRDGDGYKHHGIVRYLQGRDAQAEQDFIIEEVAAALTFNGVSYAVMMCTPTDLEDFAIGFALSEGIINHYRDVHDVEISRVPVGVTIDLKIANRCLENLRNKSRKLAGVSGCGLCGEEQLETVRKPLTRLPTKVRFDLGTLHGALQGLTRRQTLNQVTGSAHAAAYVDQNGQIQAIYEDVGRHIALDKLVGGIHRRRLSGGAILVTSRASFEMVQKAVAAGVEVLLAVSSTTQMAVELAERFNLTLLGYCRQNRANVYTHPERVVGELTSGQ